MPFTTAHTEFVCSLVVAVITRLLFAWVTFTLPVQDADGVLTNAARATLPTLMCSVRVVAPVSERCELAKIVTLPLRTGLNETVQLREVPVEPARTALCSTPSTVRIQTFSTSAFVRIEKVVLLPGETVRGFTETLWIAGFDGRVNG